MKKEYFKNRLNALKKDKHKCKICGMSSRQHFKTFGIDITVDHINGNREDNNIKNLQTLCLICHGRKDSLRTDTQFKKGHKAYLNYKNNPYFQGKYPWNKGKKGVQKHSEITRKKISNSLKGIPKSFIHKKNISLSKLGSKNPAWKGK